MQERLDRLNTADDGMRKYTLYRMMERCEKELQGGKHAPLAEDIFRIVDELLRQEQERLDQEINVHVVFAPSAAGSMKVALSGCGRRLESRVIHWEDWFSYGPIRQIHEEHGRLQRDRWMEERLNHAMFGKLMNREHQLEAVIKELANIPENRRIYLWCGDNAHEQISLRLAMYVLNGKENPIHIMNVTQLYQEIEHKYEPEVDPHYVAMLPLETLQEMIGRMDAVPPVDESTNKALVADWMRLAKTTDTLRIWKNGEIVGLEEDAFDTQIMNTIRELQQSGDLEFTRDGYVRAGRVAAELFDRQIFDSHQYIEYRFWHLISTDQLKFNGIPYALYLYSVKIP
ncbi:DUF1835 domain-containing protein [Paenibacillus azoreducens]|uniref:DUF1835 domain-containing protein n=1 Tax=Paenibacillus azoreducens TaxID=116718 RepID=UPI0039F5960F